MRSELGKGSGRTNTVWTTLKIAAFAPIPIASVSTATKAKPGLRRSVLQAKRKSCQSISTVSRPRYFFFRCATA
jgi:hypothetical protein